MNFGPTRKNTTVFYNEMLQFRSVEESWFELATMTFGTSLPIECLTKFSVDDAASNSTRFRVSIRLYSTRNLSRTPLMYVATQKYGCVSPNLVNKICRCNMHHKLHISIKCKQRDSIHLHESNIGKANNCQGQFLRLVTI